MTQRDRIIAWIALGIQQIAERAGKPLSDDAALAQARDELWKYHMEER